jgi:hypothetical protein
MKFKIVEGRVWNPKTESISDDKAKELLRTDYSEALQAQPIYRGIWASKYENPIIITPDPRHPRLSWNTSNYYTLLINNSNVWKGFPKRQLIGTTNTHRMISGYAETPNQAFRLFPKNGSKVGIVPAQDIWDTGVKQKNDALEELFSSAGINNDIVSYKRFVEACKIVDDKKHEFDKDHLYHAIMIDVRSYIEGKTPLLEYALEHWYNPKEMGFTWKYIKNFKAGENQEVWTDSPSLLIHYWEMEKYAI